MIGPHWPLETQKWLINIPTRPVIISVLLMSLSLSGTDSLGIKTSDFQIKTLKMEEAFIPCTITDYGAGELDVKRLSVSWTLKTMNGSDKQVYLYVSGTHTPTRPGSYISDSEIIRGNVALHLPRVQFTDEGEYTCTVFYTPNKQWGHSTLQVSVQPTGSLQPPAGSVLIGTEKRVQCEANGFYPKDITIQWVKRLSETNCISLDKDSCTGDTSGNEDGTFNVTSHLTITPTLEDDGRRYLCIIKHRSLENELKLNFTLSVTEPPTQVKALIAALLVPLLGTVAAVLYCIYCWRFIRKVAPKFSAITGAEHLVHMNRVTLSCLISGFRPKPIRITLWLKRKRGEVMEIYSWNSETQTGSSAPVSHHREEQRVVIDPEKEELKRKGLMKLLQVEMNCKITTSKSQRLSNCQCTIHITPDIDEDDGAELTVKVTHSALRLPISESCRLKVRGVEPRLLKIISPPRILHGKSVTLTCPIIEFKPKPLRVTWLKVDSNGRETELLSWDRGTTNINDPKYSHQLAEDEREEDDMNYFFSNLTLKPTVRADDEAQYVCRTYHYATGESAKKHMEMQVLAVPNISPLQTSQEVLSDLEAMGCGTHSFIPKYPLYEKAEFFEPYVDLVDAYTSELFYNTRDEIYNPYVPDIGKKFRCEVCHRNVKSLSWKLKHMGSGTEIPQKDSQRYYKKKVGDFKFVTSSPKKRKPINRHGDFSWSDGIFPTYESHIHNSNLSGGSGCISKAPSFLNMGKSDLKTYLTF